MWKPYEWYYNIAFDMVYLRHLVWPFIRDKSRNYDAFNCIHEDELGEAVPWPTQRIGRYYVGVGPIRYEHLIEISQDGWEGRWTCPEECRPKDHKNWTFC